MKSEITLCSGSLNIYMNFTCKIKCLSGEDYFENAANISVLKSIQEIEQGNKVGADYVTMATAALYKIVLTVSCLSTLGRGKSNESVSDKESISFNASFGSSPLKNSSLGRERTV